MRKRSRHHRQQTRLSFPLGYLVLGSLLINPLPLLAQPQATPNQSLATATDEDGRLKQFEAFSQQLSGSRLQGQFSIDAHPGELKAESYDIQSVSKLPAGDLWLFKVRIRYGDHDVNVPLPITVSWAGTTPVIVVDQLNVPGLGVFDARVVINGQRYAGTWQHGDVGGHLFGKIVPTKTNDDAVEAEDESE